MVMMPWLHSFARSVQVPMLCRRQLHFSRVALLKGSDADTGMSIQGHAWRERGISFEEFCKDYLKHTFQMKLEGYSSSGPGDDGIDLEGNWEVLGPSQIVSVIVQCKSFDSRRISVRHMREFDAVVHKRASKVGASPLGLFATRTDLTTSAREWFVQSENALGIVGFHGGNHMFELNSKAREQLPSVSITRQYATKFGTFRDHVHISAASGK